MSKQPKAPPNDPEQSRRFEETARELGADKDDAAFKKAIGIVVPAKPKQPAPASGPRTSGSVDPADS